MIPDPPYYVLLNYLLLNPMQINDLWDFVFPFKGRVKVSLLAIGELHLVRQALSVIIPVILKFKYL